MMNETPLPDPDAVNYDLEADALLYGGETAIMLAYHRGIRRLVEQLNRLGDLHNGLLGTVNEVVDDHNALVRGTRQAVASSKDSFGSLEKLVLGLAECLIEQRKRVESLERRLSVREAQ